ncbi:hypothetical protein [Mycolicibacterium sp. HS_4_1]
MVILVAPGGRPAGSPIQPHYNVISTSTPAIPLTPTREGYVRVEAMSGAAGCSITTRLVACQRFSGSWAASADGQDSPVASITDEGQFHWFHADLGALAGRVKLGPGSYSAQGWTIVASEHMTTFTNDRSGRGMSVGDRDVRPF